jgi:hypothetical protein
MVTIRRCLAAGLCALAALALAAPAAEAGGLEVRVAKSADGPYQPSEQLRLNVAAGKTKTGYIRVLNKGIPTATLNLTQLIYPPPPAYKLRWFKGQRNITGDVRTSGFEFKLKPNARKTFRMRVTPKDTPDEACVGGRFATSPKTALYGLFSVNADPGFCSG